ncbi:hypothetical protein BC628DRAFT_1414242 [Trametes gibbosa]|nr:hypothetical protein BC628DRAFT_1414242 [Trametes gibbosa]
MKSLSASLLSVALLALAANAQLQINTPNPPTQCVPIQFTWSGGNPPFFLVSAMLRSFQLRRLNLPSSIFSTGPQAAALQQYPGLQSSPFTWSTNITAGTSIGLMITDSTGATAQSAPVTIQSGPDTCLNGGTTAPPASASVTQSESASASGSASATAPPASSTGAASTGPASTGGSASPASSGGAASSGTKSATSTSGSPSASTTGNNNGALGNVGSVGIVGLLGALAAAFLA